MENHPCWSVTVFRLYCDDGDDDGDDDVHRSLPAAAEERADGNVLENKGREEESEATKPIIMVDVGKKRAKNLIRLPTRLMLC